MIGVKKIHAWCEIAIDKRIDGSIYMRFLSSCREKALSGYARNSEMLPSRRISAAKASINAAREEMLGLYRVVTFHNFEDMRVSNGTSSRKTQAPAANPEAGDNAESADRRNGGCVD